MGGISNAKKNEETKLLETWIYLFSVYQFEEDAQLCYLSVTAAALKPCRNVPPLSDFAAGANSFVF